MNIKLILIIIIVTFIDLAMLIVGYYLRKTSKYEESGNKICTIGKIIGSFYGLCGFITIILLLIGIIK